MGDATSIQRQMIRAIEEHDLEGLRELYHADYTYTGPDGTEEKGAEAGVAVAQTYTSAFPDLSFEVVTQHAAGKDTAIVEMRVRGTHKEELDGIPATGREITLEACNIVQVRDGKIVRERDYYDGAELLKQLGVLEG
jgi:steroid delta-isomerase-like uncharacterized protein